MTAIADRASAAVPKMGRGSARTLDTGLAVCSEYVKFDRGIDDAWCGKKQVPTSPVSSGTRFLVDASR